MGVSQKTCHSLKAVSARGFRDAVRKNFQHYCKVIAVNRSYLSVEDRRSWLSTLLRDLSIYATLDTSAKVICRKYRFFLSTP